MKKIIRLLNYKNLEVEKRVGHKIARNYIFLMEFLIGLAFFIMYPWVKDMPGSFVFFLGMLFGGFGLGAFISNTKEFLEKD